MLVGVFVSVEGALIAVVLVRPTPWLHQSVLPDYFIAILANSPYYRDQQLPFPILSLPSILSLYFYPLQETSYKWACIFDLNLKVMLGDDMPGIASRLVSSVQKREVMWNIIQPGDPYDIRKSMIAKLPGQRVNMGDHLELVCLLQAAEIERLCEYLEEYKLKFREVERRELDRHSYEVQIKELTMRIADQGNFRAENLKLREFLRKQSAEFEQLKKRTATASFDGDLLRKYEEALRQAESFLRENESLKEALGKSRAEVVQAQSGRSQAYYKLEIEFKKLQFQNKRMRELAEGKNRQIEQLQGKSKQLLYQLEEQTSHSRMLANSASALKEYQNRFSLLGQQIQRLNMVLRDKSAEFSQSSSRLRLVEDERRRQNEYINQLESDRSQLEEHIRQLEMRLRETGNSLNAAEESRTAMRAYEGNMEKLSAQIDRLNTVLRKKVGELEEANRKVSQGEYELRRGESARRELEDFRGKFSEINRRMAEYETRIAFCTQEIERLTSQLKRKTDQASSLQSQLRSARGEIEVMQQQSYSLQIEHKSQITRLTTTYESKMTELTRENQVARSKLQQDSASLAQIDRLNQLITNKNAEIDRLQSEIFSVRQRDSSSSLQRQKLVQLEQRTVQYESRVREYQLRINEYESEMSASRQEGQQLRTSLEQYEKRIMMLSMEIERLNSVLKKGSPTKPDPADLKRLAEYENKLAILNQEIERLNDTIRTKDNRLKNTQAELAEFKQRELQSSSELQRVREELRVTQTQLARKNSDQQLQTQTRIRQLYDENHQLTRSLSECEHQITVLSHQIQRLNGVLKLKVQASDSLQQRVRSAARESDELRKKLAEYQNKISSLAQESERARSNYQMNSQFELESAKRKVQDQERRIVQLENALRENQTRLRTVDTQTRTYQQQIRVTYQQTETLRTQATRRYSEYQSKLVILSNEIQRLNGLLQKFSNQNQELKHRLQEGDHLRSGVTALEERIARTSQESQDLRRKLNQAIQAKNKLSQDYQVRIRQITTQKDQQYRRVQESESKLAYLMQELQHSNSLAKDRTDQLAALENKVRSLANQNNQLGRRLQELGNANRKLAQSDNKIALLSQQIERLNGVLRGKVEQVTSWQSRCRTYELQLTTTQRRVGELQNNVTRELQSKNTFLSKENEELKLRLRQLSSETAKLPDIQNRLALTLGEVERLNVTLRAKTEEVVGLNGRLRGLEQQVERARRRSEQLEIVMQRELKNQSSVFEQRVLQLNEENQSLRKAARELSDANRKIPELQNKVAILSNEIERLNEILHKYAKEIVPSLEEKHRNLTIQYDQQRRRMAELGQATKVGQQAASRLRTVSQENQQNARRVQEYELRMTQISGEIERLNSVLRSKVEEITNLDARCRQIQAENEQITKRLREATETARRVPEYEGKMALLGQQIQRLNGVLRSRGQQVAASEGRIRMLQHELQSQQRRLNEQESAFNEQKKYRLTLEQKITVLTNQSEEMRRNLRELSDSNRRISDYESRMALLSQEIERLNGNLRMKTEELASMDSMFRNYRKEAEGKLQGLSIELQEQRRKASEGMSSQASRLAEYEGKMVMLSKQIERLNLVLKETSYQLENGQMREKQYLQEIERLNNTLRLKVEESSRWQQMTGELKIKVRSYQETLTTNNSQFEKLKFAHAQLGQEYKKSTQHLVDYEQSINKLYLEFERLQSIIQTLKKENYELKVRLQQAGNLVEKNRMLSAEIDRLQRINEQQAQDLEELRLALSDQSALQKRINQYMALMVVLFAEIESLRRRVKDTERQIETVRRSSLAPFKV